MVNVKIMGISCSARHANTEIAVKWALKSALNYQGWKQNIFRRQERQYTHAITVIGA